MGGTEILQPLKHIYSQPCFPEHPRQLFVFTDGEVRNTKEVLDLVRHHAYSHRCFSFGIGEGASTALITGLAKEGSGHAQFITGTDRMQPKVLQSLRFALQPAVNKISVQWNVPDGITVDTLSPPINVLFQGQRSLIYAQLKGQSSESSEGSVMIQYNLKDQPVTNQLHFCLKPAEDSGLSIHRLAARTLIRCLEREERAGGSEVEGIRRRMVELSVEAGVSSVHTAFIAINKDSRQAVKGPLIQRRVPAPGSLMTSILDCFASNSIRQAKCVGSSLRSFRQVNLHDSSRLSERLQAASRLKCGLQDILSVREQKVGIMRKVKNLFRRNSEPKSVQPESFQRKQEDPEPQKDPFLQLVFLQKASGCWELNSALAQVFGKTEDELTNQRPAQVDGSVWATLLALIWLHGCKIERQVEWQFLAMKAESWIRSQNVGSLSQCVCVGNVLLGCQVTEDTLGI